MPINYRPRKKKIKKENKNTMCPIDDRHCRTDSKNVASEFSFSFDFGRKFLSFSAMAMAMSIYETLGVLVFPKISLPEMLFAFGNDIRFQRSIFQIQDLRNQISQIRFQKTKIIFFRNRILDMTATDVPS